MMREKFVLVRLQIEAQNNMLEVQAMNNKKLLTELDTLLESLYIPPQVCYCILLGYVDAGSGFHKIRNGW